MLPDTQKLWGMLRPPEQLFFFIFLTKLHFLFLTYGRFSEMEISSLIVLRETSFFNENLVLAFSTLHQGQCLEKFDFSELHVIILLNHAFPSS